MTSVGDSIEAKRGSWNFGGNVADTFVEHAVRSIPLYQEGHSLICDVSDHFCAPGSICYELGVSTAELTKKLANHHSHKDGVNWIGIDNEEGMCAKARDLCKENHNVEIVCDDILLHDFKKCDLVICYYTIQFIPPKHRQVLVDRIYAALNWGGALIMFEKVRGPDARFQDIATGLYSRFKKSQGFTADEMYSKTESLKGVMEPFSTKGNIEMLQRAGFIDINSIMKFVCFEGFLAIK